MKGGVSENLKIFTLEEGLEKKNILKRLTSSKNKKNLRVKKI